MPHRAAHGKTIVVALAIVTACAACHARPAPPSGDVAATLTLPTLAGAPFDPASLRGKPALVTFWRPGCPYCANALPKDLIAARQAGATAVAVMVAGGPAQGTEELAKLRWDGVALRGDRATVTRYAIPHVPYTLVLRPDGTAARVIDGDDASADELASALADAR